jgi:CRISPR-associated protein Cas8a1/Csx13
MATTKKKKQAAPQLLTISLSDPGMTPIHRAGLGGLAATALRLQRPLQHGCVRVDKRSVTLSWHDDSPEALFHELLSRGLHVDPSSGIIDFPALKNPLGAAPSIEARLLHQEALTGTFLQHGQSRKLDAVRPLILDPDSTSTPQTYRPLLSFNHQEQAAELAKSFLKDKDVQIAGWALPGAVERHPGSKWSRMEEPAARFLALCFAPVGCFVFTVRHAVKAQRQGFALIIPNITDLLAYQRARLALNQLNGQHLIVPSADDAAMLVAVAMHRKLDAQRLCEVMAFGVQPWASQQKTRTHVTTVRRPDARTISLYQHMSGISAFETRRLRSSKTRRQFYMTSPSRGAIAEALVKGRPWFEGVIETYISAPPEIRKRIHKYDRGGLHQMSTHEHALQERQRIFVNACHAAMRQIYRSIGDRTKEAGTDFGRKAEVEMTKIRASLLHAKNAQSCHDAIFDFLSRASRSKIRANRELRGRHEVDGQDMAGWEAILPMLDEANWREVRNLALLALLSYSGSLPSDQEDEVEVDATDT